MSRRPWFQFHLSTLVLLTLVAGALMWLNFRPRERWVAFRVDGMVWDGSIDLVGRRPTVEFNAQKNHLYGWPMSCCTESHDLHEFAPTDPWPALTDQQTKELDQLPMDLEYDLEYLRMVAPLLMNRVRFENELNDDKRAKRMRFHAWEWKPLAADALIAVALLIGVGLGCEFVARRRKSS